MTIPAHFDDTGAAGGSARDTRRTLRLDTTGAVASGEVTEVRIHNISATGMLIETGADLAEGESIAVVLPLAGECWARVVWRSERFFGCQFDRLLTHATLSAVELQSEAAETSSDAPATGTPAIAAPASDAPGSDASFGIRLQRLRINRGLTLAYIARQLGVSKPTVWAWEHGKARPVESRIAALAELLGVAPEELAQDTTAAGMTNLVARSREQIAAVYGTQPAKVKIWIEL